LQRESRDKPTATTLEVKIPPPPTPEPYQYIPFHVPPGTRCLKVSYSHTPGATIDIGLFAPGSLEFLDTQSFRGWSGSNKKHIAVCEAWATPGYLPGPLPPGRWHIILGLYKIPPTGCEVEIRIDTRRDSPPAPPAPRPRARKKRPAHALRRPRWLRGDLQVHTVHSDGDSHPLQVAEAAQRLGLDYIALTDHNTVSQNIHAGTSGGLIILPGEEVTTYRGHMNVIGLQGWADFRATCTSDILRLHASLARQGTLHYVNHPKPYGPPWQWGHIEEIGGLEVWQGEWWYNNWHSLATWHGLLSEGHRILGLGGSDTHRLNNPDTPHRLATPTTWVHAHPSPRGILDGLKHGRIVVTETPRGPLITLHAHAQGTLAGIGDTIPPGPVKIRVAAPPAPGTLLRIIAGGKVIWTGPPGTAYIEATLTPRDAYIAADLVSAETPDPWKTAHPELQLKALTNPIYLQRQP